VKEKLGLQLVELYGSRETGGIARDGYEKKRVCFCCFRCFNCKFFSVLYPGVKVWLRKVENDDDDDDNNDELQQGEVCVCTPRAVAGYYGDDKASGVSFVQHNNDRYYCTVMLSDFVRLSLLN
jgi:long-subunit acyl-CoA synthetase (AMP-forming)